MRWLAGGGWLRRLARNLHCFVETDTWFCLYYGAAGGAALFACAVVLGGGLDPEATDGVAGELLRKKGFVSG